ncbi:MAG TPA: septum site-determining protein MinC [Burkholderiaceae bacterium]|nr:septum site-determining protein MinC [Burkholderiaceae bacterium]
MPPATAASSPPGSSDAAPARRGAARPAFEFKGLSHPALRLVLLDVAPDAVAEALRALRENDPGFEWEPVVLDASRLARGAALDLDGLLDGLRAVRLHPVAVAGAPEGWRGDAERLRLGWLAALAERRRTGPEPADAATEPGREAEPAGTSAGAARPADGAGGDAVPDGEAGAAQARDDAAAPAPGAMVVNRPVRSGQQIYARGRDLVVVGDVSPGAEVIADGDVHVYGTLGGRAIAGARGRRDAGIFTLDLRAELVAVCGIYRTFEDGPPAEQAGRPVRISLEADADSLSLRTL